VTRHTYEIRVIGSLGPATREAFADMEVEVEPSITVLSGDLDQHDLHSLLDRVRALGLELVEIKQASPPALPRSVCSASVRAAGQPPQCVPSDIRRNSTSSKPSARMRLSAP
jgi:hypothetical protein